MNTFHAVQLLALTSVTDDDFDEEIFYRRIFRWYSEKFATPLHQVYELDLEFVLQHFFEVTYEAMPDHERDQLRLRLIESEEQRAARERKEDENMIEDQMFQAAVNKEEQAKAKAAAEKVIRAVKRLVTKTPDKSGFADLPRFSRKDMEDTPFPGSEDSLPPDIKFEFSELGLDDDLEMFNTMKQPPKPPRKPTEQS